MTDRTHPSAECLDDETLAEYIEDGAHPSRSRELVEAHLADCRDCYELFAEAARTQAVLWPGKERPGHATVESSVRFRSRPRLGAIVSAGLAAAAAVWLGVAPPDALVRWASPERRPELEDLVAAVGPNRAVEGRLSGGFAWGRVPSVTRGESSAALDSPEVRIATARLSEQVQRQRTSSTIAALGTAQLAAGHIEPGIVSLEEAVKLDAGNAFAWSDLAAGYLARSAFGTPEDLARPVGAAERAIALNGSLREAHFNKALALEQLTRTDDAIAAWRAYLERDGSSPWADEARRRLEGLEKVSAAPRGPSRL